MSRYDGLIIPRSYSEYINKTDAATLLQALQLSGVMDAVPTAGSNHPVKSDGIYNQILNNKPYKIGLYTVTLNDANGAYIVGEYNYVITFYVNGSNTPTAQQSYFIRTECKKHSNNVYYIEQTAMTSNTHDEVYTRLGESADATNWTWSAWEKIAKSIIEEVIYPSESWAPGMTSREITEYLANHVHPNYTRIILGYSQDQNFLTVSFSKLTNGVVYMNVQNGYTSALASAIKIRLLYIK